MSGYLLICGRPLSHYLKEGMIKVADIKENIVKNLRVLILISVQRVDSTLDSRQIVK